MAMSDFEKQLKQFVPKKPSTDVGELFYQCGWNAREALEAPIATAAFTNKKSARRQVPTFLAGIACGLMASVATFLWQPSTSNTPAVVEARPSIDRNVDVPIANVPTVNDTEMVVANSPVAELSQRPLETKTQFYDWQVQDLFAVNQFTEFGDNLLSPAARESWRQQLQMAQSSSGSGSAANDILRDRSEILRAGRPNKQLMEELFL